MIFRLGQKVRTLKDSREGLITNYFFSVDQYEVEFYNPIGTWRELLLPTEIESVFEIRLKCTCGSASVGSDRHSKWCDRSSVWKIGI